MDIEPTISDSHPISQLHHQDECPPPHPSDGQFDLSPQNKPVISSSQIACEKVDDFNISNNIILLSSSAQSHFSATSSVSNQNVNSQLQPVTESDIRITENVLSVKGFSQIVIDNLLKKFKKVDKYSSENISEAIMLRSISKKAYETCRKNRMTLIPLPCLKTLSSRISHFSCAPGIQTELFNLLKLKLSTEDIFNQESVIMFDEMQLQECTNYNGRLKMLFENNKKVQVVLVRGLFN